MLIKILWTMIACITFTLGTMSLILMLVYASGNESGYALLSLCGGFGGIAFAIHLMENEVLSHG